VIVDAVNPGFVTCNKPLFALETYDFAPIKDPDRSQGGVVEE
jgi:hypothetical protein